MGKKKGKKGMVEIVCLLVAGAFHDMHNPMMTKIKPCVDECCGWNHQVNLAEVVQLEGWLMLSLSKNYPP